MIAVVTTTAILAAVALILASRRLAFAGKLLGLLLLGWVLAEWMVRVPLDDYENEPADRFSEADGR